MNNANKPITPLHSCDGTLFTDGNDVDFIKDTGAFVGLTKREHFAAMAMQGVLASAAVNTQNYDEIGAISVAAADAVLKELAAS